MTHCKDDITNLIDSPWVKYPVIACFLVYTNVFIFNESVHAPATSAGWDASAFTAIGYSWLHGLIPYKDLLDHKGPVLYFLNLLGWAATGTETGVMLLECVLASLAVLMIFYVCRNKYYICCIGLYILHGTLIKDAFEGGNMTEEYAVFFAIVALYAHFTLKNMPMKYAIFGLCGAICFYTRPNMALGPLALFFINACENNKAQAVAWTFFGFLCAALPINYYFYVNNALADMYNVYILANIHYVSNASSHKQILRLLTKFHVFFCVFTLLLAVVHTTAHKYFRKSLFFVIFSIFCSLISLRAYPHYMMGLIPAYIYIIMILCTQGDTGKIMPFISRLSQEISRKGANTYKIMSAICIFIVIASLAITMEGAHDKAFDEDKPRIYKKQLAQLGITQTSSILNLGGTAASGIFYYTGALPDEKALISKIFLPYNYREEFEKKLASPDFINKYDFIVMARDADIAAIQPFFTYAAEFKGNVIYKNKKLLEQ